LAKLPLVSINLDTVETNIIIFQLKPGAPDKAVFLRNLRERGLQQREDHGAHQEALDMLPQDAHYELQGLWTVVVQS
ncbi:hypothetical protein WJX79_003085, partial [Trebouxia sp. C0005]